MINIPIYRAKKLREDSYITGLLVDAVILADKNIVIAWINNIHEKAEVDSTTLSIHFPDMIDSEKDPVFASLREDGKGGDAIHFINGKTTGTAKYKDGQIMFGDIEYSMVRGIRQFKRIGIKE